MSTSKVLVRDKETALAVRGLLSLDDQAQRSQTDQRNGTGRSVPLVADQSEAS
jgi:hypothetical protein